MKQTYEKRDRKPGGGNVGGTGKITTYAFPVRHWRGRRDKIKKNKKIYCTVFEKKKRDARPQIMSVVYKKTVEKAEQRKREEDRERRRMGDRGGRLREREDERESLAMAERGRNIYTVWDICFVKLFLNVFVNSNGIVSNSFDDDAIPHSYEKHFSFPHQHPIALKKCKKNNKYCGNKDSICSPTYSRLFIVFSHQCHVEKK